jgi:DNA-binding ferritin-like protein
MHMPRTVDEILAHADELAERFERYEPNDVDELDVVAAASALRTAVAERSSAERHLIEAVREARQAGLSWAAIGQLVGTSGEAARQRYAKRVA